MCVYTDTDIHRTYRYEYVQTLVSITVWFVCICIDVRMCVYVCARVCYFVCVCAGMCVCVPVFI